MDSRLLIDFINIVLKHGCKIKIIKDDTLNSWITLQLVNESLTYLYEAIQEVLTELSTSADSMGYTHLDNPYAEYSIRLNDND